jgi:structural maintenance of chromosome 4
LGDLATIADEYDVAVSTACGSLDYIVVKTTSGANQCLDFLRRHNSGRASFICLDKLSKGAHDRRVETPENAPRLLDLIRPVHPNLLPAFFLAVGNTLVADDLDTAARWCYDFGPKRWRVVTRDGKLLETSGTQSGGGGAAFQKKGGMKLEVC